MTTAGTSALSPPAFVVDRPELVERLERATRRRVVLIVAPAGYGKSILLAQWHAAHPERRVVWITVRPSDDAVQFGRRLAGALGVLVPGAETQLMAHVRPDGMALGEDLLGVVLAVLQVTSPVTVVIEDLEAMTNPILLDELGLLAERAGDGVGFVFVGRDDRLPRTPRLRLRDEVVEIRQSALALSEDHTAEALARVAGRSLHPVQVQALHERTEGWPAGVHLAALGVRDHDDPDRFVADFAGDDRHVADYLSGEVLAVQPPDVTEFLLRTSVVQRLNGDLANALAGSEDGQRVLERLDQQSLFTRPLDSSRQWFNYHPLFRDLLRYELRATRPTEEQGLLQRAAAWHLDHDDTDTAALLLIEAGDWPAVIALAKAEGGRYFERGEASTVLRWLGEVPIDVLFADPDAVLSMVAVLTMAGSSLAAQELLDRFEAVNRFDAGRRVTALVCRAVWIHHHSRPEDAEGAAEAALALLDTGAQPTGGPVLGVLTTTALRSLAKVTLATASAGKADNDRARNLLEEVMGAPGSVVWLVHAHGELGWIAAATGNLRNALSSASRALAVADEAGLGHHPAVAMAHLALFRAQLERDGDGATVHLETGLARGRLNHRSRVTSLEWAERARLALVDGRVADGLLEIGRAQVQGGPPLAPVDRSRLVALEVHLQLLAGNPRAAQLAIDAHQGIVTADLAGATAAWAVATDDLSRLRKVVEDWTVADDGETSAGWTRDLWTAVLHDREGDRQQALATLRAVVEQVQAEGAVRFLLDNGPEALRLLRLLYLAEPTPFLRRLVEVVPAARRTTSSVLVEQLTERELAILAYLPSRLSNAEMAGRLYVSVNTLKTHLKNIYRKLDVGDRGEAIDRAEELGLL